MVCEYNNKSITKPMPDILDYGLKILFIGYNPGILSASSGHHYAHRSNRFWKLLYDSGLTPHKFDAVEDKSILDLGYGSTNIVDRPSKMESDIKPEEFRVGAQCLYELIKDVKPKVACFIGLGVYRRFASNILDIPVTKIKINTGIQQNGIVEGTLDFICSSTSGLNTIPYTEQLKCFRELKKLVVEMPQVYEQDLI